MSSLAICARAHWRDDPRPFRGTTTGSAGRADKTPTRTASRRMRRAACARRMHLTLTLTGLAS